MQTFRPEDLEADILQDLLEEISELYEASEQTLIELELKPNDNELQRALFRSVHTIKGDLGLVGFHPMIPVLQHVEDLLDYLRKGNMTYTSHLSDLVLFSMDMVKRFVVSIERTGQADYEPELNEKLIEAIERVNPDNPQDHQQLLIDAVHVIQPDLVVVDDVKVQSKSIDSSSLQTVKGGIPSNLSEEKQKDILFFRDLMQVIEKRCNYWKGRGDRIAKLAQLINEMSGTPIEEDQLAVACYVHDFGMAFMPLELVNKADTYTDIEFNLMRSHVYKSSRLLEHLDHWDGARKMVLQHHERADGSGYPLGLKDEDICEGAKLLAILDTFDALTHSREYARNSPVPHKKAVIQINQMAKDQFNGTWMRRFNTTMAKLLTR